MSRIGQLPIPIPKGVKIDIKGNEVTVKGPKGELSRTFHPDMSIAISQDNVVVTRPSDDSHHRELHGLTRSLLSNMVTGVTKGFEKGLEIVGVGYKVQKVNDKLVIQTGFTHPVEVIPKEGITFTVEASRIIVSGRNKEDVGQVAANIRAIKPPDHYKGKGIRYTKEVVRLKAGKAVTKKK